MTARNKRVVTVLACSSVILVWRVCVIITDYSPAAAQADQTEPEIQEVVQVANAPDPMATSWEKQRSLEERPWGRNPFTVPDELKNALSNSAEEPEHHDNKPMEPPKIGFSGSSRVGDTYRAIIRSGIVAVGDPVEGSFTVKSIDNRSVTIASGNWNYVYELGSETPIVRRSGEDQ